MDDDKKTPLGPEDQLDEHELDLNTPDDLEAVEDISFAQMETPDDPLPMFDEFEDFNRLDQMLANEDISVFSEETEKDEPKVEDKLSFGDEEAFDFTGSDAFEDINDENADFPEEATDSLGDSQLFDYEPGNPTDEEAIQAEDIYAQAAGAGAAVASASVAASKAGSGAESPIKKLLKNRRVMRSAMMLILVGMVYGVLRLFTGGGEEAEMSLSAPGMASAPAPVEVTQVPEVPEVEELVQVEPVPAETEVVVTEIVQQVPAEVPAEPAQAPVELPVQQALTPSDQLATKLSNLEASLNSIDNRLTSLSGSGRPPVSQVGIGANMGSTTVSGDNQQILRDALHKIEGIDAKMSYLSELQTQVHILSREVSALKSDVVQQSMIVGNAQAAINQSMAAAIDMRAPKMLVQAAIPGRAWLRSETGQLLTVIPGDEVAGYGRVVSIDPTSGTVVMSSRAVFREQ